MATGRFVLGAIIGICGWSTALAVGVLYEKVGIIGGALSGALVLTLMITAQPQVHLEHTFNQPVSCSLTDTFYSMNSCIIPLVPVIVIILNTILASMVMGEIWLGVIFWFGAGKFWIPTSKRFIAYFFLKLLHKNVALKNYNVLNIFRVSCICSM